MRIAFHVPRASYLKPGLGGDRIQVPSLIAGLRERGHEVKIVSRRNVRSFWRGRIPARRLLSEAISIRREIREFSPDAWLVYGAATKNPDLFGWWQQPKRYVLWQTDPGGGGNTMPKLWRWLFTFAHRRSLSRADQVTAYHPRSADYLRARVAPPRLQIFPPGINGWDSIPSREESRMHLGLPLEALIVLCVSRFSASGPSGKTDMILDLIGSMAALPSNAVLLLVGDGPGRGRVEKQANQLGADGRVRLFGYVNHEDIRWFYAACDLFAYPCALDHPFLAIMEAQSCGRPVVTMDTRSARLTVKENETGLLAKDLDQFQAQLQQLASDRTRCDALGRNARAYIEKFHSIKTRVRQIEELLDCDA